MSDQMMEVEFKRTHNVLDNKQASEVYLKLYVSFFKSGLVASLEPNRTVALLAIASFMDENGRCYPTQEQIAERLGVHRTTVNKWVNDLLEFRWNGRPVITRIKSRNGGKNANSVYTILPLSQVAIFNGEVEPIQPSSDSERSQSARTNVLGDDITTCQNATVTRTIEQEPYNNTTSPSEIINGQEDAKTVESESESKSEIKNSKDVLTYFMRCYREKYGVNYNAVYKREVPLIKSKLMANYSVSQIEQIIGYVFCHYDTRWAKPSYPRPTIGQLCSWLPNEALALIAREQRDTEQVAHRIETAESEADDWESVFARLNKGRG